jgi:hypothetical protein
MPAASNSRSVRIVPLLIAVCLVGIPAQAKYAGSGKTSTYVFVAEQSKVVRTGGIASVPRTYSTKGNFQLTVDPNAGTALFAHVDANATDDSPFKRTLDLNHVFNMTSLVGTVEPSGSIKFTGKASDGSDVRITVTLTDGLAHLIGQTTPPPNSADFFIFSIDAVARLRKYGGGSGTADDPYQIATAADLIALGETLEDYDKHFILTADIDLDPNLPDRKVFDKAVIAPDVNETTEWWRFDGTPFTGVFDGDGHTISHLRINGWSHVGLLGQLASGAEVRNFGIVDVGITGSGYYIGGLVGNNHGSVANCYSTGPVTGNYYVGGLVGHNNGSVTHCYSTGAVTGNSSVGGLVGVNVEGSVTACYSTGVVSGKNEVGGLVGLNVEGTVTACYSTGAVSGTGGSVGGLVGGNMVGTVTQCYSTCAVSGTGGLVGGLVGDNAVGTITASFWDTQTSGQDWSDGGTGKTTAEMQTASTYLEAGWDFVNIWGIGENQTYPYLRKYSAADINQDASVNFLDLAVLAENWLTGMAP